MLLALFCTSMLACGPTQVVVQNPAPAPPPPPAPEPEVSYQTFYDELSPYGQWIDYPGYGYVWMPNVGPGFKPYSSNGYWVFTDAGWTWTSGYNWGWATFHYGRWFFDDAYGWLWIPGHEWSPAWVSWRTSPEYYGWAPMGPSVTVAAAYGSYNPPSHYWSFVPHQYVASPQVNTYYVNETRNVTIINNTTIINNNITVNNRTNTSTVNNNVRNNVYAAGPDPNEVSRYTGSSVRPVSLEPSSRPGEQMRGGSLSLYRPRVNPAVTQQASATGSSPKPIAPARVQPLSEVRPVHPPVPSANGQVSPPSGGSQPVTSRPTESNEVVHKPTSNPTTVAPKNNPPPISGTHNNNPSNAKPPASGTAPAPVVHGSQGTNPNTPKPKTTPKPKPTPAKPPENKNSTGN
jgi:hypothetical protein